MPTLSKKERFKKDVNWGIGILAGLATIGSVSYFIWKDKKSSRGSDVDESPFFSAEETSGSNISQREALRRANQIYTAMDGAGTDEDAIYRAQNLVNASALKLIYNKFGIREEENMGQWFIGDLSGTPLMIVRAQWTNRGLIPPF